MPKTINNIETLSNKELANLITYHFQDVLDNFSSGGRFNFRTMEKVICKTLDLNDKSKRKTLDKKPAKS